MNEKLKSYLGKAKSAVGKVSKKMLIIAAAIVAVIVLGIVIFINTRPYAVLFTGLNTSEASAIMSWLDSQGYSNYRLEDGTIWVPESQETSLKAALIQEGYPKSGFSYPSYFDNVGPLSTESERNRVYLMALEEKMNAVIECFPGVTRAVVTITPGEDRSYVLSTDNIVEATAGVMVYMRDGERLTTEQASVIRNYVASSVKDLQIDSVTIGDNWGNQYNAASSSYASTGDASALKVQLEEEQENKVRTNIMTVLKPIFGEENVKVSVNCVVDISYTVSDANNVYLPEWAEDGSTNGAGIIGSRAYSYTYYTDDETLAGGTVGTTTNSDLYTYTELEPNINGDEDKVTGSGQIDFNNSEEKIHKVTTAGTVTDCTVSVTINSNTAPAFDVASIRSHVAQAAGINAVQTATMTADEYLQGKISVLSMPFYEDTTNIEPAESEQGIIFGIPLWVLIAAGAGLLLFIILLVIILLLRRKRKKKQREAEQALEEQRALESLMIAAGIPEEEAVGADVMSLQTEKSMELRKDIRQFAEENPEITAQLVKTWLRGGDDNG